MRAKRTFPFAAFRRDLQSLVAEEGKEAEPYEFAMSAAEWVREIGDPKTAIRVLEEFTRLVSFDTLEETEQAWLLNSRGLCLSALGQRDEASQSFERMLTLGESNSDDAIISTALLNLGVEAYSSGDLKEAEQLFAQSYDQKLRGDDFYGIAQLTLNLASLWIDLARVRDATEILKASERFVRLLKDPALLSTLEGIYGNLAAKQGNFKTAKQHFRASIEWARKANSRDREGLGLWNLGAAHLDSREFGKSLRAYRKALRIFHDIGAIDSEESVERALAVALHRAGRHAESAEHFDRARRLARRLKNERNWATATADLGAVHARLGNARKALSLIKQAFAIFELIGDPEWIAQLSLNAARLHREMDDVPHAVEALEKALRTLPEGARSERGDILFSLAETRLDDGAISAAISDFKAALQVTEAVGDTRSAAWRSALAGMHLADRGCLRQALEFYDLALAAYESLEDREMEFHVRNDRAIALIEMGEFEDARRELEQCRRMAGRLRNRVMRCQALMNLGELHRQEGNLSRARSLTTQALELARQLGDKKAEAELLGNLGLALADADDWRGARTSFQRASRLGAVIKDPRSEAAATGGLALVAFVNNDYSEAANLYRKAVRLRQKEGKERKLVEDVAGLTESWAALGRSRQVQKAAQYLVDLAQELGANELASEALARTASWYLKRRDIRTAVDLFAASVVVSATGQDLSDEGLVDALGRSLVRAFWYGRIEEAVDLTEMSKMMIDSLNQNYEGSGDQLREVIDVAHQAVESRP